MGPGEIYLAQFPFGDVPGMTLRPVLLTSRLNPRGFGCLHLIGCADSRSLSDIVIDPSKPEFRSTHLKTRSALRLHKLATIHFSSFARYLGVLDSATQSIVATKLRDLLKL